MQVLLGTVENFGGNVVAGLDWLYDDRQPNLETNMVGTQIVSWWTRADERNTILQVTNTNPDTTVINTVSGALEGDINSTCTDTWRRLFRAKKLL